MNGVGKLVVVLTAITVGSAASLALVYSATKGPIDDARRKKLVQLLRNVLPPFDNEIDKSSEDKIAGTDSRGREVRRTVYTAKKDGKDVGRAFQVTARDGYSGDILVLMGVAPDGSLTGVEIVAHKETPGLGDKIAKKAWRETFKGKSLKSKLDVKKDGGEIDQFSGATISPRAVTKAVKEGLKFVEKEYGGEVRSSERGVRSEG
ncbi:MAG: RnfABCDGE type electron transport complex subunit G [Nitrospirae bacterium]|nr:RnfABCDGE type electron transport complex subunit G [Nitrospirota bacterium]MBI3391901.1 RnfABCDGE type electron transport complex subunit G [Nitrospirota bacterium]